VIAAGRCRFSSACLEKQVAYLKKMVFKNNDLDEWQKFRVNKCKESRQFCTAMLPPHDRLAGLSVGYRAKILLL
jgi:hypothetical protein